MLEEELPYLTRGFLAGTTETIRPIKSNLNLYFSEFGSDGMAYARTGCDNKNKINNK